MKEKKKCMTILLSLVMTLSMGVSAFAESLSTENPAKGTPGTVTEPAKAVITKTLKTGEGTTLPSDMTFTFKFTQYKGEGTTGKGKDINGTEYGVAQPDVTIGDKTVTVTTGMAGTTADGIKTYEVQSENFLAGLQFPSAGIYVYDVEESKETDNIVSGFSQVGSTNVYKTADGTGTLTYSMGKYRVYVYVANGTKAAGESVTYVKNIGIVMTTAEGVPGTPAAPLTGKIDGTPGTSGTPGEVSADNSKMKFTNNYLKTRPTEPDSPDVPKDPTEDKQALSISKTVAGDYGDKTRYFPFEVKIAKPVGISAATEYRGFIMEGDKVMTPVTFKEGEAVTGNYSGTLGDLGGDKPKYIPFTFLTDSHESETLTVYLKDNQKLVIFDAEVGAKYRAKEPGTENYTPGATLTINGGSPMACGSGLSSGADLEIKNGTEPEITIGEKKNKADVTNTYIEVTPTGIMMNNLPFFSLIALGCAALVIYVAAGRKKRASGNCD